VTAGVIQSTVFGLLSVATAGALLLTQRLEGAPPPVERVYYPAWLSPNGDGVKDIATLRFRLPRPGTGTVQVVDADGAPVRTFARDVPLGAGRHAYPWDGRTDAGRPAPEGDYRLRVALSSEGRTLTALHLLTIDTTPPRPEIVAVTPRSIVPGGRPRRARARIRYRGPSDPAPLFTVYRLDGPAPRAAGRFLGPRFREIALWDGRLAGRRAAPGTYAFRITVRDRAGNAGSAFAPGEKVTVGPAAAPK
jgi:hypothetical protein